MDEELLNKRIKYYMVSYRIKQNNSLPGITIWPHFVASTTGQTCDQQQRLIEAAFRYILFHVESKSSSNVRLRQHSMTPHSLIELTQTGADDQAARGGRARQ